MYKAVALHNKLAVLLQPPKPKLVVKDLLTGEAQVRTNSSARAGSISDDEFAQQRQFRDAFYLLERLSVQVNADEGYMTNYLQTYANIKDVLLAKHSAAQLEFEETMAQSGPTTGYKPVLEILGRMADMGNGLRFVNDQLLRATLPGRSQFPAHVIEHHNRSLGGWHLKLCDGVRKFASVV